MISRSGSSAYAQIDLGAIERNARSLRERSPSRPWSVELSADAFGHGADRVLEVVRQAGFDGDAPRPGACDGGRVADELYGFGDEGAFEPAMRVAARVLGLKTVEAGEGVSYGLTYRAAKRTNLAFVGIGYAHGLDRSAGNRMSLLLAGAPRRIAGRVAMNSLMVELGDDVAAIGDEAIVFGDRRAGEPSIASWAAGLGIGAPEAATAFGAHLPRLYR